jgi:hypothetical protein
MDHENVFTTDGFTKRPVPGWILMFVSIVAALTPCISFAHGVVGNRIFLSPIVGNDAFPDNAMDLTMRRSNYEFSLLPALEKQMSDNSSLLFVSSWQRVMSGAGRRQEEGFGDLSIYYRQGVFISVPHEMEITLSPFVVLPVGNRQIADQGYTHLGGELLLGKGLGDLPDRPSLKYLRPFALQAELGYAGRIQGPANSDVVGNLELEYSLEYLDHFVERINVGRPLVDVVPYVQFNYSQSFIASRLTTKPDFRLTPGFAYLGDYCEFSVGAQAALNGAALNGDHVAVIGLVEVFYDNIFPILGRMPFRAR